MPFSSFGRAILPLLLVEAVLYLSVRLTPSISEVGITILYGAISFVVLPFVAGFRVVRAGGGRIYSILGGIAISVVDLTCAVIEQLIAADDSEALLGFVLATLVITVPLQAVFSFLGGWTSARRLRHGAS